VALQDIEVAQLEVEAAQWYLHATHQ
jgi:hypothetical protein